MIPMKQFNSVGHAKEKDHITYLKPLGRNEIYGNCTKVLKGT